MTERDLIQLLSDRAGPGTGSLNSQFLSITNTLMWAWHPTACKPFLSVVLVLFLVLFQPQNKHR